MVIVGSNAAPAAVQCSESSRQASRQLTVTVVTGEGVRRRRNQIEGRGREREREKNGQTERKKE